MNYYKISEVTLNEIIEIEKRKERLVVKSMATYEEDKKAYAVLETKKEEILKEAQMKMPDVEIETIIRNDPMTSNYKESKGITFFNIFDEYKCDHLIRVTKETKTCPLTKGLKVKIVGKMINDFGTIEAYEITEA